jgi:hypothetical protein
MRLGGGVSILRSVALQLTTQLGYLGAIALAMVVAGLGKKRLEWKPRPKKRRKVWR